VNKVAASDKAARARLFSETAAKMGLNPVLVEKDFWVCWLLKQLFTMDELNGWLVFKGGTSLSKCFNLIQRFSEDLDIAVDFEKLGFTGSRDPRQASLSHTKRAPLLALMLAECQRYVAGPFLTAVRKRIQSILGREGWLLEVSPADPNTVEFQFPAAVGATLDYIRPRVVLELGTHAEPIPHEPYPVRPFAAEQFPQVFGDPVCQVPTVVARRTFWEKATILHAEYHRPLDKPMLPRYSRHYVDVAMMSKATVVDEALADLDVLKSVVVHKDRFYHCGWAKYLEARPGRFRLLPRERRLPDLRRDYEAMNVMFFGDPPTFDDVMSNLANLEHKING